MKILQVIPVFSAPFGGPVTVVRSISKELAKRHEVTVYTTTALDTQHDFNPKEEQIDGYQVIYFSRTLKQLSYTGIFGQINLSLSMMKAVKGNLQNYDLVHIHSWNQFPEIMVHYYAKKYGIPYILQIHGSAEKFGKPFLKWAYDFLFGYTVLKGAAKVIALNQIENQQYLQIGVPEDKIEIIPNGIDLSEYVNLPAKGTFKKILNVNDDTKLILYLGRIHKIKGLDILIEAFKEISKKLDNVKLIIIGPDDGYLTELIGLIKALKIENKVMIFGPLYDLKKLMVYVDADVYVLPSRYETFPLTILEALACNTPVIITDKCGAAQYFEGTVGIVSKFGSEYLKKDLLEILQNESIRKYYSNNCRSVVNNYEISNIVSTLEKIYREVM